MHRIDGPGATVDNKFTEGDPVGGVQATVVTDDFMNDVQEELISILAAAGVTPVKGTQNQVLNSIAKLLQSQKLIAFPTAGTATALTLTPSPAIDAYAADLRFRVKFNIASGLNPTLNVSAKGAKSLKQYDSAGAKVAAVFAANQLSEIEYDGVDFIVVDQLPVVAANLSGIKGASKNLALSASGTAATVSITADELVLGHSSDGTYVTIKNINLSATTAAGGLDAGVSAINTWYAVWIIYNPTTGAKAASLSLSATGPALPTGFTYSARVGWARTDGTANKYPLSFVQAGRRVTYKVAAGSNVPAMPVLAAGAIGNVVTPVWAAASVSGLVPPTAGSIVPLLNTTGGYKQMVAPNNAYGGFSSTTNPAPLISSAGTSAAYLTLSYPMLLESTNIFVASEGNNVFCAGWEDNL